MQITLHNGKLQCGDRPFFGVGCNYHPSATGCQYWRQWNAVQIERDLQAMAQRGFNVVRFFVFWADFEPQPGVYDVLMLERIKAFVHLASDHGLYCIPSLLTIWMNGQLFDLPWRQGRDLWTDAEMVYQELQYVRQIATCLKDAENVLAYDLGDEMIHVNVTSASALPRYAVIAWQAALSEAIRAAHSGALVLQAQELSALLGNHAFRPEHSQALDLIAIHGYPTWTPLAIEAIASYKASMLVPFLVQMARLDGPVLVDELGCYGADEAVAASYIGATVHSILANGAQSIIVWCWQDFMTTEPPYSVHPGERYVGLLDAAGNPKPAMFVFQQFAEQVGRQWAGLTLPPAPIGVYLSPYENHSTSYLHAERSPGEAAFSAYLLLKRAHLSFEFTRGPLERYQLVICPSFEHLSWKEQQVLAHYVAQGGVLYYSPGSYLHGFGGEELFGIRLHDFTLQSAEMTGFSWQGQTYPVSWTMPGHPLPQIPVIAATSATVLATFPNGTPALTCQSWGRGQAYYLNAPLERYLNQPYLLEAQPWHLFYTYLAEKAQVQRMLDITSPEVEVTILRDSIHSYGFVINHSSQAIEANLIRHASTSGETVAELIVLEGKEARVVMWDDAASPSDEEVDDDH